MNLNRILQLEEDKKYVQALEEYRKVYSTNSDDYMIWRHYYFILWYIVAEDFPLGLQNFVLDNKIQDELKSIGFEGMEKHRNNPDAQFVLGYTIGIFPYFFGEYIEWENKSMQLLERAHTNCPADNIYKLAYLGSISQEAKSEYIKICKTAAPDVQSKFRGNDLFNSYFRDVLYRVK